MASLPFASPQNTPATSTPVGKLGRPRKLRTSCDGCHSAKVKCTKEKPACTRCMSLGFCCIYSPSLRAGKIRQKSRDQDAETSVRNELDLSGLRWDQGSVGPDLCLKDNDLGDFSFTSGQEGFKNLADFQESCSTLWQDPVSGPLGRIPSSQSGSLMDSDPTSLDSAHPSTSSFITSPSSSLNLGSFFHDEVDLSGLLPRSLEDFDVKQGSSAKDDLLHIDPTSLNDSAKPVPPCPRLSYKGIGLKKLASDSTTWSSSRCFSSLVHALHTLQRQTEAATTSLDIILATSKEAVGWCEAVLRCACTSDSTVIMLLAALVGKILTLYHSAYEARKTSSTTNGKSPDEKDDMMMDLVTPCSSTSSGNRSLLDMTAAAAKLHDNENEAQNGTNVEAQPGSSPSDSRASPARVTLGAYRLDSEDEGRLELELMLIELRKVDGLLGRFRKRVGTVSVKHESRTYESLAILLAKTLRATVERLQRNVARSF